MLEFSVRRTVWRLLILTHRYLGIGLALLVLAWCLSGIVMMYVQYPEFGRAERLAGSQPLDLPKSEGWQVNSEIGTHVVTNALVEKVGAGAILRARTIAGVTLSINLATGQRIPSWSASDLDRIANDYATKRGWAEFIHREIITRDQWTVQGQFNPHRPLTRYKNDAGIEWYVSGVTGEIVQATTTSERFWNWLGAVVHWIYPTLLRQHVAAWSQTVIWLSVLGLFLTVTGLIIGIKQLGRGSRGGASPYNGWALWHHYAGLVFGLLTLTWLFSGLMSMNPLDTLQSRTPLAEREILNGGQWTIAEVVQQVRRSASQMPADTVQVQAVGWLDELQLLAYNDKDSSIRFGHQGVQDRLSELEIRDASALIGEVVDISLIDSGDNYYYSHHQERRFPVYRLTFADGELFYIDANSGELVFFADRNAKVYRWMFNALHSADFNFLLRKRPLWDVTLLLLLAGVTIGVVTGTWLAYRRILQ